MAEIRIQRKRPRPWWPFLLLLLVILIGYAMSMRSRDEEPAAGATQGALHMNQDMHLSGMDAGASGREPAESRLSRLRDYEVADGYPDIRGWPVRGTNGRDLGIVGELVVDADRQRVAAIDVHLGVGPASMRGDFIGATRLPMDAVQIQRDRYVIVDVEAIPCRSGSSFDEVERGEARLVPCAQIGIQRRT